METTKAEFARRKGVTPAAITDYCRRGMPVLPSGRLDVDASENWLKMYNAPNRSGSFRARRQARKAEEAAHSSGPAALPRANAVAGRAGSMDAPDAFRAGYNLGRAQLRASLRRAVPPLLAEMNPNSVEARICTLAVVDHLCACWIESSDGEIEIDWSVFTDGITPAGARAAFEEIQAHCTSVAGGGGEA